MTSEALAAAPLVLGMISLVAVGIVAGTLLRAWQGWLALKHAELARCAQASDTEASPGSMARIELADLKQRIRKLEAIASGVDP